jgi:hypothetical protein
MGISKRTISWMGALGAATLLLGVLWILRPGHPESVILISIDALRADRLGCYGYSRKTTPALDRVAAKGVLFEEASTTHSPVSLSPSVRRRARAARSGDASDRACGS